MRPEICWALREHARESGYAMTQIVEFEILRYLANNGVEIPDRQYAISRITEKKRAGLSVADTEKIIAQHFTF